MEILQQLPQLEALCERLYNAQSQQERAQVEQMLGVFSQSVDYIAHLKAILDNSSSPYAQHMASTALLKIATENSLSPAVRAEMKNYFLNYLDSKGPMLQHFVVVQLVQLLCRTVKLGWSDHDTHRNIVEDCKAFLEKGTSAHYLLALRMLNTLVQEMNLPTYGRTLTQHRKIAVSFRDTCLFKVFQLSLMALQEMLQKGADSKLKEQGLTLSSQCLSFDFVGTCLDDSSEEICTIQVPSSWRPVIEEPSTLQLFLDYYGTTAPPLSNVALECLVRMASVRRSLFTNENERFKFLNRLVNGTREILRTKQGLHEHDNYHEFCRLLGRLKTNYQLSELVAVDNYTDWIQQVAELTINSLNSWQWASSSVYYLLGLWSRLVSSMPYLKGDSPSLLEANVPQITQAYITSRLESVALVMQNNLLEDMLDNEEQLAEQMDALPSLVRFQYDKSAAFITRLLDPVAEAFTQAATQAVPAQQLAVVEGQLTWLVYIVGAIIKGRLSSSSAESQESIDGDLAARVLGLLAVMDDGYHSRRYGETSRQRLDTAVINFFQCFRKVYIGEQVMHSSKVYTKLQERLGLADHQAVLNVMLTKVAKNLQVYGSSEELVHLTLTLFQDLAAGYMSGKLLMKLESITFLLSHHTAEYYGFLDHPTNTRNRTTFYATLSRLLFMDDVPLKFKAFVAPLQQVLVGLAQASNNATNAAALRQSVPKGTIIGLFRDLRGIATATNSRRTHSMLFDWLYPQHFPVIIKCLEAWADVPEVCTPLLKFVAEFVFNKSTRLTFDASSPNGILLFREVSKVLTTYGSRVLSTPSTGQGSAYDTKYKGIWVCLLMLARAMSGNYVNFGVFELYGDPALKDALDMALRLVLSIPLTDILAYRKVSRAYFNLLEVLAHNHTGTLAAQDTSTFTFLLSSLEMGLKSLDVAISGSCASAVDNLAGFYFKNVIQGPDGPTPPQGTAQIAEHVRAAPHLFPEILRTLFEIVLFEECSNQWSLSRPMLSLILINEQIYNDLRSQIIATQPPERQAHLSACLDKLMADVQRNLEPKNRDKFTQNLTVVRHEYRSKN
mmetsp:Transcript_8801/g.18815  ORF Transcript_8801/g.18815 Transcript_8801/m.18815 type:complete len:1064 (-) Transcript_8801:979-4170(-)|eukprot:CAMPEP_0202914000 /NCGR_PEP_ID=MMETSP1392-20130828/61956_1 /ASSEMBLY_ACC=CAM_ASM_000868 /TAXON_ID=225041 /ORGANISM="Chlamydomonas chlamydogama, Strain SAG 11-48b" /LENGTH=1063 /DNA_ID=CAMNT_0049605477 /DNA_START=156 /DNA_END=3347 /DNA_ORIENTATION=-